MPEFGGFFLDSEGNTAVYVTDLGKANAAQGLVRRFMESRPIARQANLTIQVRQGQYTFSELATWRDLITEKGADLEGIYTLDLDERRNRLHFGVRDDIARTHLTKRLKEVGIPPEAVLFYTSKPSQNSVKYGSSGSASAQSTSSTQFLTSHIRPMVAGLRVQSTLGHCTLGPIIQLGSSIAALTNSHCSPNEWGLDNHELWQPYNGGGWQYAVGTEASDPAGWSCYVFYRCRRSDSAIYRTIAMSATLGKIARTMSFSTTAGVNGSMEIDPNKPTFTIIGDVSPLQGEIIHMMASFSGWVSGKVDATCLDDWGGDHGAHRKQCNIRSAYQHQGGDSGAPVFIPYSMVGGVPSEEVYLLGIHWGYNDGMGMASRISGAKLDHGGFETH